MQIGRAAVVAVVSRNGRSTGAGKRRRKSLLSKGKKIDPARRHFLTNIGARDGAGPLPDRAYGWSERRPKAATLLTTDIESLDRDDRQFADTVWGRFAGMGCDVTIYGSVTSVGMVYGPDGGAVMREPVFRAEAIQFRTPPDEYPFDPLERGEVW
ncbi:hypothetical protein CKO28_03265 [Rhodovibrio sodomensis]|uniref:Uncharacterized protein n=1 Tax=Rhodovibrio sodomensis TaxID=1088 RepID=A0ABS1DA14_9PROT|nr:hypothetical protein [Rhodovibrio sodomensis]MBK1667064.1 hypothetical protein [Rhodovibrio sodomensis]